MMQIRPLGRRALTMQPRPPGRGRLSAREAAPDCYGIWRADVLCCSGPDADSLRPQSRATKLKKTVQMIAVNNYTPA
jgi:hypothetical protein